MKLPFPDWPLPLKALAAAVLIAGVRVLMDQAGLERISVSPLVATIITANVFILGFLLTGVLSDYKESERLPGELSISMGAIADECILLWRHKQAEPARDCLHYVLDLTTSMKRWFYKTERTQDLTEKVYGLGDFFVALEPFTQANFIVRLKQEQSAISRMLVRIHTIRETSFVASGYTMARLATGLVLIGLLSIKIDPWYESVFLIGVIAWFLSYLILLIEDLDNPFDYGEDGKPRGQEVSLKPLEDLEKRLAQQVEAESPAGDVPHGLSAASTGHV
jgi:hypothetical protein